MGTSRSVKELQVKLTKAGAALGADTRPAVAAAANVYKEGILASGRKDSGGDLRLSRWGRKQGGLKLGAGYELKGTSNAQAIVRPRPEGVWNALEAGAKPHLIVPGLTRRQGRALTLFSIMAGQGGSLDGYDVEGLAASARGNRNNRGGRRRARKPLLINGQLRAYAKHPGFAGKRTFSNASKRSQKPAISAFRRKQMDGFTDVFR
jgi:hypothetical protein